MPDEDHAEFDETEIVVVRGIIQEIIEEITIEGNPDAAVERLRDIVVGAPDVVGYAYDNGWIDLEVLLDTDELNDPFGQ